MNINSQRFYLAKLILDKRKGLGWRAQDLLSEMQEIDPSITIKQIRTPLSQLVDEGILSTAKKRTEYIYSVNSQYLQLEDKDDSNSRKDVRDFMLAILIATLKHFNMHDQQLASEELVDRILFACSSEQKLNVLLIVDQIRFYHQNLFGLPMQGYRNGLKLAAEGAKSIFNVTNSSAETITFQYEGLLIRGGTLVAKGYNLNSSTKRYFEIRLEDITSVRYIGKSDTSAHPQEENKLENAHNSIGLPASGQLQTVVLELNDKAWQRARIMNLPMDATFNETEKTLEIIHPLSEDLALFVLRLGDGVTIKNSIRLREMVREQIEILKDLHT